ncbi:MAG TPA: hypothetical protein VGK30_07315 [Candidatus Binatia bacterium]
MAAGLTRLGRRLLGALRLDPAAAADVASDPAAGAEAAAVVLLATAATAVGRIESLRVVPLVAALPIAAIGWAVWLAVATTATARLVRAPATRDVGARLRALAFAAAPALVETLGMLPLLRPWAVLVGEAGIVLAGVIAIRTAFAAGSTSRVFAASLAAWIARVGVMLILVAALRPLLVSRIRASRAHPATVPTAGYLGVVKPSGIAPPEE